MIGNGWRQLLLHHLEECRDRYTIYVERHDALTVRLDQMEQTREKQFAQVDKEIDAKVARLTLTLWKIAGFIIAAATVIVTAADYFIHLEVPGK